MQAASYRVHSTATSSVLQVQRWVLTCDAARRASCWGMVRVCLYMCVGGQVGRSDGTREYMRLIDRLFALGFIVKLLVRFQSSPLVTCKI